MRFKSEFSAFSAEFSPFCGTKIAVATSQYFGIIGNGRQYILGMDHLGLRVVTARFELSRQYLIYYFSYAHLIRKMEYMTVRGTNKMKIKLLVGVETAP